jgi:large subunit ribosomal protein L13
VVVRHASARLPDANPTVSEELLMRTYSPRPQDIEHRWYVVDADGMVLGRLATRIAHVLRGKHKPIFAPHMDVGDHVIVLNAAKVKITGAKGEQRLAQRHSGYPGGLKSVPFARLLAERPEEAVERAVRRMLPRNSVGRAQMRKLKVYAGPDHPHEAQRPEPLPL